MNVKTDTKEKFHVITVNETTLSASMTEEMGECLLSWLQNDASLPDRQACLPNRQACLPNRQACLPNRKVKNLVIKLNQTSSIDMVAAEKLVRIQQQFYENDASFVICELQPAVEEFLDKNELLEMMNVTPTESEAWDIVQMEEIEREFLQDEDS